MKLMKIRAKGDIWTIENIAVITGLTVVKLFIVAFAIRA